ncbi:MAG TPA: Rne/Rng family ribonuclease, partial [Verrucomicrobiae bacterium]|nr:Rne/Rng family ribonuclease [Verrucomicrobiae bacterium]
LILMPTGKYSGVSRKIDSADERNRLKAVMKRIRPEGMATVVRTAAAGVSEAELIADLGVLIRMWHGILETYKRAPSPSLLHKDMNLVYKAARDFITSDVERVLIDDEEEYKKVRDFLQLLGPQYLSRVEHYNSGRNLFDDYKVTEELQKLMKPKINLPSGGSIVIETTEALTVIDVNSGKFTGGRNLEDTIVKTNVEAANEIARQVRLRDIGGIIVVDFIDMSSEAARNKVIKSLEDGLRRDRTRATIQSFSNLGLLEFTRKRVGKDLGAQLRGSCPTCSGLGSVMSSQSVAIETFRQIRQSADGKKGNVVAHVAPTVASQMEFWYEDECEELARSLAMPIHVRVDPMLHPEKARVDLVPEFKEERSHVVRVGDEHDVELLPGRLPNATSAAAVVDGHIVEVENAANNAGNTARIRIIDVDDEEDYVLAELMTAGVAAEKKKRRGRGRGRKGALTATEESKQLRELAEEAARFSAGRPPIGITTVTEEEEAEDKALIAERRGEKQADAIIIAEGEVQHAEEGGRGKRRRRRRGRRGRGGENGAQQSQPQPQQRAERAEEDQPPQRVPAQHEAGEGEGGHHKRRRRRRGRRGRGSGGEGVGPVVEPLTGGLPVAPTVPDRHIFRVGSDGAAHPTGATAPREPSRAIAPRRGAQPPAVEPPPPSLTMPEEQPKKTKPARRRRTVASGIAGELEATPIAALPPAQEKKSTRVARKRPAAAAEPEAPAPSTPKRTARKTAASDGAAAEAKPKRVTRKKAGDGEPAAKKAPARKRAAATKTTKKKP